MDTPRRLLIFAPAIALLAACGSTEPHAKYPVSVSAGVAAARVHPALTADLIVGGEGGSVSISSAQIVLSRLKLANNDACADEDDDTDDMDDANGTPAVVADSEPDDDHDEDNDENEDEDDEGCPPLNVGPLLIDLPLDGSTTVVLDALVPAGTYTRLQARLHAVKPDDEGVSDFLTAHPEFEG